MVYSNDVSSNLGYEVYEKSTGLYYDIDQSLIKNLNTDLLKSQGFELLDYKLEFYGLCPSCQKTES